MLDAISRINWLAVAAATIATTVVGGLWFTVLFGKAYAAALGREYDPKTKPGPIFIFGPLVCTLITTITSALLVKALNLTTVGDGLTFGAIIGFGYSVATMTNIAINPNMPHPFRYSAVNAPFFFLTSLMTGVILVTLP